jgi:uncharacterized protein
MSDTSIATAIRPPFRRPVCTVPLRIVIPGGEGHLGCLLAQRFSTAGHAVTTLSRRLQASEGSKRGWAKVLWNGSELGSWVAALENADVILNLSGRSVDCRYNPLNREQILRSRVDSTAILAKAIQSLRCPPRLWLNASTATIYRHSYDRVMDEHSGELGGYEQDAPSAWRFSVDVARQWEETFFDSQTRSTRKVALRAAMVMSPASGGAFPVLSHLTRLGLGGTLGDGRQYMSWIHEADFCRAVEFLIERDEISGPVNLAAPHPLPNREFMAELRRAWRMPLGVPARGWMLSVGAFFMRTETELLLKSRRVVPAILREHGFDFRFPTWTEAASDLVRRWKEASEGKQK